MPFDEDKPADEAITEEIIDMIAEEEAPPSEEKPEEKPEEEENPKEEEKPKEEPEEKPEKKEELKEEKPKEEETPEGEEEETISLTKEQLAEKEELAVLRAEKLAREKIDREKPPKEPKEPDIVEYVSSEDATNLQNEDGSINVDNLNILMNKIVNVATVNSLKAIPEVVGRQVNEATTNKQIIEDFYKENESLNLHRSYVGFKANELAAKEPGLSLRDLLIKTAVIVKKDLAITEEAEKKEEERKKPKSPRTPKDGGKKDTSKQSDLEAEMDEMMEE